jgi:hypothetical protein
MIGTTAAGATAAPPAPPAPLSTAAQLRQLVDTYEQTQRMRIQLGNRRSAVERGTDEPSVDATYLSAASERLADRLAESEDELVAEMRALVHQHPVWPWLSQVRGIGPTLGAKLVGLIGSVEVAPTVSALWRFAGYAVIDGERERLKKGEKAHFNRRLKTACYLVATSFLRSSSPYRTVYDQARARYDVTHADWTDGHKHAAAMRKMVKLFLSHLWEEWRKAEGLPVRPPYALEYMEHTTYHDPKTFLGKA